MSHLKKFRAALAEKGADAAIIGSKLNQKYLSDFDFDDGFVLVTKGQSYLITDFRYVEAATEQRNPELEVLMPNIGMLTCMGGTAARKRLPEGHDRGKNALLCRLRKVQREADGHGTVLGRVGASGRAAALQGREGVGDDGARAGCDRRGVCTPF